LIIDEGELVHLAFVADIEPITWKEAITDKEWKSAMIEELESLRKMKFGNGFAKGKKTN